MKTRHLSLALAAMSSISAAQTIATIGQGSAVTSIGRIATFDGLDWTHNGTPISDYTENQIFIGTSGDSWAGNGPGAPPYFNPFHVPMNPATQAFYFPDGGSTDWTVIQGTDSRRFYAVEFLYGNGWTTGDIYGVPWGNSNAFLEWKSYRNGVVVSTGVIGPNPQLNVGSIVGFYDIAGFDQLRLRCRIANAFDPNVQALAIDDFCVQLFATAISGNVILQDTTTPPTGKEVYLDFYQGGVYNRSEYPLLNASGHFASGTTLTGMTEIKLKASHWLAKSMGSYDLNGTSISLATASLVNGDVDGDNEITLADYSELAIAFGSVSGDANWDLYADLDEDGEITLSDYSILSRNFGQAGD